MTDPSNPAPAIDTSAGRVDAVDMIAFLRRQLQEQALHYLSLDTQAAMLSLERDRLRAEVEALRKDAIEECAQVCDAIAEDAGRYKLPETAATALRCAREIRALQSAS